MSLQPNASAARRGAAALLVALLLGSPAARADTVWTIAGGGKPFERPRVKIEKMQGDGLVFRSASQDRAADPKSLKEIHRVQADGETALNAAENAYVADKWDEAISGYQRAVATSGKEWVRQYATLRLLAAAEKSGKFSAAAAAFVTLVQTNPAVARGKEPAIPGDKKAELPAAIEIVKAAVNDSKLKPAQRNTLKAFLASLYLKNGQAKEAEAIAGQAGAARPAAPGGDADPAPGAAGADKGQVDLKLQLALASLNQKKFKEALTTIESISADLTAPEQQAQAMFCIAEAEAGLAGNDPAALKKAALAYMRVVTHFKNDAGAPHVAESLLKTGLVLEQAKLLPDALQAFQDVQDEYKNSPQAKEAADGAARVRKAIEAAKG
jgi:hypothetical protein